MSVTRCVLVPENQMRQIAHELLTRREHLPKKARETRVNHFMSQFQLVDVTVTPPPSDQPESAAPAQAESAAQTSE